MDILFIKLMDIDKNILILKKMKKKNNNTF